MVTYVNCCITQPWDSDVSVSWTLNVENTLKACQQTGRD